MFLEQEGLDMPREMRLHLFTDTPTPGTWGIERPKHLIMLERSMWPDNIKEAIVKIYQEKGLPDPMRQKLVEPIAFIFGGQEVDGVTDLTKINWQMVIDYFTWEAEAIMQTEDAERLQEEAEKKYGGIFSHHEVYKDPNDHSMGSKR
jgi:hypothetical protein